MACDAFALSSLARRRLAVIETVDFAEKPQQKLQISLETNYLHWKLNDNPGEKWMIRRKSGALSVALFEIKLYGRNSRLSELLHSLENSALNFSAPTTLVFKVLWTVSFNCFCAATTGGKVGKPVSAPPEPRPLCAPLANNFLVNNCAVRWKVLRAIDKHTSPVVLAPLLQSLYHLEHLISQFIGRGRVEKPRAARPFRCSTSEPGQSRLNKSAICHRRLEIYENSHGGAWNSSEEGRVYLRWHFSRHVCLAFFHLGANQDGSRPRRAKKCAALIVQLLHNLPSIEKFEISPAIDGTRGNVKHQQIISHLEID